MKVVVVILDGAADHPVEALSGKTPLEAAHLPNLSFLAQRGRTGMVDAVFDDLPVESIVAALGILGYDPYRYFPHGRASFEAAAGGVRLAPSDLAFRCNLISVSDGRISDFTAGLIHDVPARSLILGIPQQNPAIEIFPSQSYRNILVYRQAGARAQDFVTYPPHQHRGSAVEDLWIRGTSEAAQRIADELNQALRRSVEHIRSLNLELKTAADMLWLWSPSDAPQLPPFRTMFGRRGGVVAGLHFLKGIGLCAQMLSADVPGATGYIDSNLPGKTAAAIALLDQVDVVVVHLNAADEEAHQRNLSGKLSALELFDEQVVGPLARHLRRNFTDYRMAVLPDHYTCVADGHHIVHPVPCLVWGSHVAPDGAMHYAEREVAERGSFQLKAWDLMPMLLSERIA